MERVLNRSLVIATYPIATAEDMPTDVHLVRGVVTNWPSMSVIQLYINFLFYFYRHSKSFRSFTRTVLVPILLHMPLPLPTMPCGLWRLPWISAYDFIVWLWEWCVCLYRL